MQIDILILYKASLKFRKMVKLEGMDFCKVVGNTRSTRNGFVKRLFDEVKKFAPNILRRCPVNGRYQLANFTIDEPFSHLIPTGSYLVKWSAYSSKDQVVKILYNVTITMFVQGY